MAEFSKEYIDALNLKLIPDFSYLEESLKLKNNSSINLICEGIGSIGLEFKNGKCYLLFLDNEQPVLLETIVQNLKNNKNNV